MKYFFKNNKGLSYVELMIVIAIMSIMIGISTISIGAAYRNNTGRIADQLYTIFYTARSSAMTNGTKRGYVNFVNNNDIIYYYIGEKVDYTSSNYFNKYEWKKLCGSGIEFGTGNGVYKLDNGDVLVFKFDQATGRYTKFYQWYEDSDLEYSIENWDVMVYVQTKSHKNKETLQLDHITGKIVRGEL